MVNSNRTVTFTPQTSFTGTAIATYRVSDDQGLLSATAVIEVFVLNFSRESPWQNPVNRFDVNEDRMITPLDASILIDEVRNGELGHYKSRFRKTVRCEPLWM